MEERFLHQDQWRSLQDQGHAATVKDLAELIDCHLHARSRSRDGFTKKNSYDYHSRIHKMKLI